MTYKSQFGLGFCVCITGVVRSYYTYFIFYKTYDQMWYAYSTYITIGLEMNLGVVSRGLLISSCSVANGTRSAEVSRHADLF
jgi:hypothetical protein